MVSYIPAGPGPAVEHYSKEVGMIRENGKAKLKYPECYLKTVGSPLGAEQKHLRKQQWLAVHSWENSS